MTKVQSSITVASVGAAVLIAVIAAALAAPVLAPHEPDAQFSALLNAPPTRVHVVDDSGAVHWPFVYPLRLVNQLEQLYESDRSTRVALKWFANGRLVQSTDDAAAPLLILGTDSFGRDVLSRVIFGARISLGLSVSAAVAALMLGALIGGIAGYTGGAVDELLMRGSEFVLVLPAMYVVLALRAVMPLVLSASDVFLLLVAIFGIIGAPPVARGVRAIISTERRLDYAVAAASLGAGHLRLLLLHLLPASFGFLAVQLTVLLPAFIVAEATLSYVGLGFPEPVPSWGTMLQEGSTLRALSDFPWLLSPAVAMFLVVLAVNLILQRSSSLMPDSRRSIS